MWRPGTIGMITDHGAVSDDRVIRAFEGFHSLKSPTTATRRARGLSNTNCSRIGADSAVFTPAVRMDAPVAAGAVAATGAPISGACVVHAPRATKPTTAAAAAIPSALQIRIDRPREPTNTGSSAGDRR